MAWVLSFLPEPTPQWLAARGAPLSAKGYPSTASAVGENRFSRWAGRRQADGAPGRVNTCKRAAPTLQRVAFKTSRLAEFCGEKELTAQTGHTPEDWPLVIAKELTDNALDACEETEIAPEIIIEVSTKRGEIFIADNGPGLPAEAIDGVLDYNVRVSSREASVHGALCRAKGSVVLAQSTP
jgi:hypothetical protein